MIKIHSGFGIMGSAMLSLLAIITGLCCLPSGLNDPQSSAGFFTLAFYFFLQSMFGAFRFDEEASSTVEDLFKGINKLVAATMILMTATPHPQFTGVLLWLGVSFLLFYSGVRNILYVSSLAWEEVKAYRQDRAEVKKRIQIEIEITKAMKAEEAKIAQEAEIEKDLLSDLTGFLGDSDSKR